GDRIGAVDERGEPVLGDQLLVLFGRDLVRRFGKGKPVIFDVKCSEVLPQMLKKAGLQPVMWKTGHSFIKQKMKEIGAPLAGEMSGHMFFGGDRSEEHTSELQSLAYLVCRLLLEKKKKTKRY